MSDDQDFAIEAGDHATADEPTPAPPPLVVIEYRNRGLPSVLLPPLLILLVALAIVSYQRTTPARGIVQAPPPGDAARPHQGRTILVEPPTAGVAVGALVLRGQSPPPASAPNPSAIEDASKSPTAAADLSPFDLDATDGLRPVDPQPPALEAMDRPPSTPPAPTAPEATSKPEPAVESPPAEVAVVTKLDRPAIGFQHPPTEALEPLDPPEPDPPQAEPELTKEQILAEIRREAAQKQAERQELEEWKPQRRWHELAESFKKIEAERATFHQELRQVLKSRGEQAGSEIEDLCNQYGRDTFPEVRGAVKRALKLTAGGLHLQAKVELMRTYGLPEPMILDYIANKLHPTIGSRGGPRDENGVRVQAARLLLSMPLKPPRGATPTPRSFRPGSQPVASGPRPSLPIPGPRP